MIPQVDNLRPQPRTKRREVRYLRSRLSRSRVLPLLSLSSVRLIYERPGVPVNLCGAAFPRSLIALSCNIIASISGAARPVPHGRAHEILRRGRSKSISRRHIARDFVRVYLVDRLYLQPGRNGARVVSDFVHTLGVRGKSIKILRPTK